MCTVLAFAVMSYVIQAFVYMPSDCTSLTQSFWQGLEYSVLKTSSGAGRIAFLFARTIVVQKKSFQEALVRNSCFLSGRKTGELESNVESTVSPDVDPVYCTLISLLTVFMAINLSRAAFEAQFSLHTA